MKDSLCVMTSDYLTIKNNDLICCSEVQTKATWEKSQNECTSRKTTFANQYFHDVPALVLIRNISVSPFWNLSTRPCRWFVGVCNQKKSNCSLVIEIWFPEGILLHSYLTIEAHICPPFTLEIDMNLRNIIGDAYLRQHYYRKQKNSSLTLTWFCITSKAAVEYENNSTRFRRLRYFVRR